MKGDRDFVPANFCTYLDSWGGGGGLVVVRPRGVIKGC